MQKDIHFPQLNSGSSKLPAAALFNIVKAYTQPNENIRISLNRLLTNDEKEQIGEIPNLAAQLICDISQKNITPIPISLSQNNVDKVKVGANNIDIELKKLEMHTLFLLNERMR